MEKYPCRTEEDFWRRVDRADARELVTTAIGAARAHVAYGRALSAARRADVLLGKGKAGAHELEAEAEFQSRNSQLRRVKQLYGKQVDEMDADRKKRCEGFFAGGGLGDLAASAKQAAVIHLLAVEVPPEELKNAAAQLDDSVRTLGKLPTFEEVNKYVNNHIDELVAKKFGNPSVNPWCVLLLVFSSLFALLAVLAALICALTFGLACQKIFDSLIASICGE